MITDLPSGTRSAHFRFQQTFAQAARPSGQ
jgi:hypothetical protein